MSDDGYGDDFEQYDDEEFENDDEYEVLPQSVIKASITAPAQPLKESPFRPASAIRSGNVSPFRPPSGKGHIDLPTSNGLTDAQRKTARKRLALARQKMAKVQLEAVVIDDLFAMAPLTLYDLSNMARSVYAHNKVACTQTNEDAKEEECQTDEVDSRAWACQVPGDRNAMTEEEVSSSGVSTTATAKSPPPRIAQTDPAIDSKLNAFMQWAGPMVLAALGMAPSTKSISLAPDPRGGQGLSSGRLALKFPDLLANRPVNCICFSHVTSPLLLAAYGPVGAQLGAAELLTDHSLGSKGCMCVWDLSAPSKPHAVLISEGTPTCCAMGPALASNLVFAGMEEGGICAWDLDESEASHPQETVAGLPLVTRRPSYTTEHLADTSSNAAPIVAVAVMPSGGSRSSPCSLISLSAWGNVLLYSVTLLSNMDVAMAEMDLGMRITSRMRLLKSPGTMPLGMQVLQGPAAAIGSGARSSMLKNAVQAFALQLLPGGQQLIVGADCGKVLRGSCMGTPSAPKEFIADDHKSPAAISAASSSMPSCVTSLHVSPFCSHAFLSGHQNGTVALHTSRCASAAAIWPDVARGAVRVVRWSPSRPCVFLVLDSLCTLYVFDLAANRNGPAYQEVFMSAATGHQQVPSMATWFDVAMMQSGGSNSKEGLAAFALGYDDGCLECHGFANKFTQSSPSDLKALQDIVGA